MTKSQCPHTVVYLQSVVVLMVQCLCSLVPITTNVMTHNNIIDNSVIFYFLLATFLGISFYYNSPVHEEGGEELDWPRQTLTLTFQ